MTCAVCADRGLLVQEWTDADPDFAVCLCEAGQRYRLDENWGHRVIPQWRLWCARYQVDPARVFLLEEIYSRKELAAVGLRPEPVRLSREAALMATGKRAKR